MGMDTNILLKYIDLPAPSLHGNNRECGAQEVNIIVSRDLIKSKNSIFSELSNAVFAVII